MDTGSQVAGFSGSSRFRHVPAGTRQPARHVPTWHRHFTGPCYWLAGFARPIPRRLARSVAVPFLVTLNLGSASSPSLCRLLASLPLGVLGEDVSFGCLGLRGGGSLNGEGSDTAVFGWDGSDTRVLVWDGSDTPVLLSGADLTASSTCHSRCCARQ